VDRFALFVQEQQINAIQAGDISLFNHTPFILIVFCVVRLARCLLCARKNSFRFFLPRVLDMSQDLQDVTGLFADAAADMAPGQMLHIKEFSLAECMNAIEIMDPRMDSGMGVERIFTMEEALKLNFLTLDSNLSPEQILAVIDQLLCLEVISLPYSQHSSSSRVIRSRFLRFSR
jgi:hypothetical protein